MRAAEGEGGFRELLEADGEVTKRLDRAALDAAFGIDRQLRYVETLINRALRTRRRGPPRARA